MKKGIVLFKIILLAAVLGHTRVSGFNVMPSLNTFNWQATGDVAVVVVALKSDGAWFITQNSDFKDSEWRAIFESLGGRQVSEDNPGMSKSYTDYMRIMGEPPADSMCYNETGGLPGGTLLSQRQIAAQFQSHGKRPIICLTRSYGGKWMTETDRCLRNPRVSGICMEYVKEALLNDINAPAECIKAVLKEGKRVYMLLHAAGDGWTLGENKQIIRNLNSWCPEVMRSADIYLVYQDYGTSSHGWFGPGGVKEAIDQACKMPNYTGMRKKAGKLPDNRHGVIIDRRQSTEPQP